jgi:hypothetical protein
MKMEMMIEDEDLIVDTMAALALPLHLHLRLLSSSSSLFR